LNKIKDFIEGYDYADQNKIQIEHLANLDKMYKMSWAEL
jgi:hypothetical protein